MRLEVHHKGVEVSPVLRAHITDRVRLAVRRFGRYVRAARVYLRDVNGPRGGADKECRIVVEVPRDGRVVVTGTAASAAASVTRTAGRAGHALGRHLKRRLARRRTPAGRPAG